MSDDDGRIDYSIYSYAELVQAKNSIDAAKYPKNFNNLSSALSLFDASRSSIGDGNVVSHSGKNSSKYRTPVGKHGLIEISLKKRYVAPLRVVALLLSLPFLKELFEIVVTGEANMKGLLVVRGENWGYYAELCKVLLFSLFLLWLGTLGVKAKDEQ